MIRIIPAIDIMSGKCVRLQQGDFSRQKIYNADPLEVARRFQDAGLQYLHLVDLDGARAGAVQNWKTLETIASGTVLKVDFGGGLKSEADLQRAFDLGAHQVNLGSVAVRNPSRFQQWLLQFGPERLILSADVRNAEVVISGWQEGTGIELLPFLRQYLEMGLQTATVTEVSRDGMLAGTALELYRHIRQALPELRLIASGGVSSLREIEALQKMGLDGVIIGKSLYEGRIQLQELEKFLC